MSQKVLSQIDADGNATVMLNRPEVHNAFDPEMVDVFTATLRKLEAAPKVRAIVVTGAGKSFCAGADIEHMKRSARFSREQNLENARATAMMLNTLYALEKPTSPACAGRRAAAVWASSRRATSRSPSAARPFASRK